MTQPQLPVVEAVTRLRAALEQTSSALVAADLEGLLRSEGALELALRSMPRLSTLTPEERLAVRDEATKAQRQLARCQRFGDVLLDVVRITFEAQGRHTGYGPRQVPAVPQDRRGLDTRG